MARTTLELDFFEVNQNAGTFYCCEISAQTLLEICQFDFRQIKENGGVKEFMGIQRPLKDDRVNAIRKYLGTSDACFPTSIVISVDERCASFATSNSRTKLVLKPFQDADQPNVVVPFRAIATIIDGQHRLKAFEGTSHNWSLTVNIFVGVDEATQAMIFSTVNLAQTKVNKSLVYDLFSLDRKRSPEKTSHELVVNLNEMDESPFRGLIKRLGSATDGVFGETLSQATIVKGILPYITNDPLIDRDIGRRIGVWPDRGPEDFKKRIFYPFFRADEDHKILAILINYYSAISEVWADAWKFTGKGGVLPRTNGFNATIRFLRDAYLYLTVTPSIPSKNDFIAIFRRSELTSADFNVTRFQPGSGGAAALYKELLKTLE